MKTNSKKIHFIRHAVPWYASMLAIAMLTSGLTAGTASGNDAAGRLGERELARKARNDKFDRHNLRRRTDFVTDQSDAFLVAPQAQIEGEFDIASTPPIVKLQILPHLEPEHFSEEAYQAGWANWAKVTRSDDNRFYLAASDHLGRGSQVNLYEYRPDDNLVERALDVSEALGWHKDMYTDGKLHGRMGIMPDGTLWAATHRGPAPTDAWWEAGYRGSWLLSFNVNTRESKNWGVPLIGNELPVHTLDERRGIFVATGMLTPTILSWDVNNQRVRFAGYPPNGWIWHARSIFLDSDTGIFWGMDASQQPYRFMSFDPELNRFQRYDVEVPTHPQSGNQAILRGHTTRPAMDGWFYWATQNGTLFRFKPDLDNGPVVETVNVTWDKGRDTLQLALCPAGRYIYYVPKGYPSPLVQYDVSTGRRKAIAFLQDYYYEKYGYWPASEVYGMEISKDGDFAVIADNGTFEGHNRSFGHPSIMVVEIPESERPLD